MHRLVFPTITAPAALSRWTRVASRPVTLSLSARLPAVVGIAPLRFDVVLDEDGQAEQRAPSRPQPVQRAGLRQCVGVDCDYGMDLWIELLNPRDGSRGFRLGADLSQGAGRQREYKRSE